MWLSQQCIQLSVLILLVYIEGQGVEGRRIGGMGRRWPLLDLVKGPTFGNSWKKSVFDSHF